MNRIKKAQKLCSDISNKDNFDKGLFILGDLATNVLYNISTRLKAIEGLYTIAPDYGNDKISQIRDSLKYLSENDSETEKNLIIEILHSHSINSHERLICAVCLFNNYFIVECYPCFWDLSNDESVILKYRVEAIRFLIYSEIEEYYEKTIQLLISIISDHDYTSNERYRIIAGFNTKTGLNSLLNHQKLRVDYDENLMYQLQNVFFFDENNDFRDRILSGQHLLQLSTTSDEKKIQVGDTLLDLASNIILENLNDQINLRADAADVVQRLGDENQKRRATMIIHDLGFAGSKNNRIKDLTHRVSTTYNNAQNVHDTQINKAVQTFIETVVAKNNEGWLDNYENVHAEVSTLIHSKKLESRDRIRAFKALNRISIDTATFTHHHITAAGVFVHIWLYIKRENNEEIQEELKKRLIEELIDMASTCSSGHASRLVNILNGYGFELKISFKDQIISNASARMQALIKNIEDEDLKSLVLCGMTDLADEEEKDAYIKFLTEKTPILHQELYDEFVEGGHTTQTDFEEWFDCAVMSWN